MATPITLEHDAPPFVRVLGVTLRRAAADPGLARTIERLRGRVVLRSSKDAQAATITFGDGAVSLRHGADADAELVITADLDTLGRPGAPKPQVKGAVSHPKLALGVAKVLDPPVPGGWRGAAAELWSWAEGRPGRPSRLRLVCTDGADAGELTLGGDGRDGEGDGGRDEPALELHGPAWALVAVLTGGDHLGQAVLEGRIQLVADLPRFSRFTGLLTTRMLGLDVDG